MDIEYNANQFKEHGNQAYKSQDYKKALTLYSRAIQENPKESTYYLNRALCHFNLKNFAECIHDCNRSIELNPSYTKAMLKKSSACIKILKF
jgi:tetratricopeptide (TPR) repeat protein